MVGLPDAAGQLGNVENVMNAMNTMNSNANDMKDISPIRDIREMPIRVLRGLFSGIGQLLLAADRFRAEEARRADVDPHDQYEPPTGQDGEQPTRQMTTADHVMSSAEAEQTANPAPGRHRKPSRSFRSMDATGNVRLLTPDMPAESTSRANRPAAQARAAKTTGTSKAKGRAAKPSAVTKQPVAVDLPVPGFDGFSLASIRARLRYLDAAQLRILVEHEKSASNRADVIGMLERRITKIEPGTDGN